MLRRAALTASRAVHACTTTAGASPVRLLHTTLQAAAIKVQIPGHTPPTTQDVQVNVTFVNYAGARTNLVGRVGQTLLEVAQDHDYEFLDGACGGGGTVDQIKHDEDWTEDQYGEGAICYHCHVVIAPDRELPESQRDEHARLSLHPLQETISKHSRLGCQVTLSKDMDGMTVHCPDNGQSDIP